VRAGENVFSGVFFRSNALVIMRDEGGKGNGGGGRMIEKWSIGPSLVPFDGVDGPGGAAGMRGRSFVLLCVFR